MNGTLPHWIQRLLGVEVSAGEGAAWGLEHRWPWPPWVSVLLVALIMAVIVLVHVRQSRQVGAWVAALLAMLRMALVAIVLAMIAQFVLTLERTGLPYLAVVIDDSLSMGLAARQTGEAAAPETPADKEAAPAPPTRLDQAKAILLDHDAKFLRRAAEDYKLRVYWLTGLQPAAADDPAALAGQIRAGGPRGEVTRLGGGVEGVLDDLRGTVPAGIVLLTDGVNTEGPELSEAAAAARARGVPLFTVGLGDEEPLRDVKLTDLVVDEVVFVDDVVYFEAKLTATGYAGQEAKVVLHEEGKPDVLAETTVLLGADGRPLTVRIPFRPRQVGQFRFVLEAPPREGERDGENNRQARTVRVRKERIRVLLVQGYPSFEFRYLRNMLARDATIKLDTLLQDADLEHAQQDATAIAVFPVRREDLFAYDVIILDDANVKLLGAAALEEIAEFVRQPSKGGALVIEAGPENIPLALRDTPLEPLLPISIEGVRLPGDEETLSEGFVVEPTELGLQAPPMQLGATPTESESVWKRLPPLYWLVEAPDVKPAAHVWAVHPRRLAHDGRRLPVIAMQYVGAGKVVMHLTDETWRWRLRRGDVFFARYWIQLIRYLSRSKLAEAGHQATLATDRREYIRGEPVRLRAEFADDRLAPAEDDGVTVVVEHPGGKTRRLRLARGGSRGRFEGELADLPTGPYHAWIAVPTLPGQPPAADFAVAAPPGEFERVEMDARSLRQAAEQTRGRFYTAATAGRLLGDLPSGHQVPVEAMPPKPLWNRWPLLALFLAILTTEWIVRKRKGLV